VFHTKIEIQAIFDPVNCIMTNNMWSITRQLVTLIMKYLILMQKCNTQLVQHVFWDWEQR